MPKFYFNLISVSKLVQDLDCHIIFGTNGCFSQGSLLRKPLLLGRAQHALYILQDSIDNQCSRRATNHKNNKTVVVGVKPFTVAACNTENFKCNDARYWHLRMRHLPYQQFFFCFQILSSKLLIENVFVLFVH